MGLIMLIINSSSSVYYGTSPQSIIHRYWKPSSPKAMFKKSIDKNNDNERKFLIDLLLSFWKEIKQRKETVFKNFNINKENFKRKEFIKVISKIHFKKLKINDEKWKNHNEISQNAMATLKQENENLSKEIK